MTFSDPVPQISKVDVDRMLRQAQEQTKLLYDLEQTMNANRDYLTKVGYCSIAVASAVTDYHPAGGEAQR